MIVWLTWFNVTGTRRVNWLGLKETKRLIKHSRAVLYQPTPDFECFNWLYPYCMIWIRDNHTQINPALENCQQLKITIFQVLIEANV